VIKTCQYCGAVNGDQHDVCCFCDVPLGVVEHASISSRGATPIEGNLAVQPEWRREVSSRLQDYRARRRGGPAPDLQAALPFDSDSSLSSEYSGAGTQVATPAPPEQIHTPRKHRSERYEISIPNRETSKSVSHALRPDSTQSGAGLAHAPQYSVASLPERRRAAIVDVGLLLFSYGGMLALFTVLGGHISFDKLDLAVLAATFGLFYAQYFALFTIFGGSTPGMMLRGLRVVTFNGGIPTSRQMAWRSFGYLISAGTCFLGFVWALWDDDQLCWQDRISQTYLTTIEQITPY
jgi:uncharacterized RDD family membrane protein YckC